MSKPRVNYNESRLARALVERGVLGPDVIEQLVRTCSETGALLAWAIVESELVGEWELSRIASELFGLPFLPVDVHTPDEDALRNIEPELLLRSLVVPLTRNDDLLTVAIPATISTQVYEQLCLQTRAELALVVGTVSGNRRWLEEHLRNE